MLSPTLCLLFLFRRFWQPSFFLHHISFNFSFSSPFLRLLSFTLFLPLISIYPFLSSLSSSISTPLFLFFSPLILYSFPIPLFLSYSSPIPLFLSPVPLFLPYPSIHTLFLPFSIPSLFLSYSSIPPVFLYSSFSLPFLSSSIPLSLSPSRSSSSFSQFVLGCCVILPLFQSIFLLVSAPPRHFRFLLPPLGALLPLLLIFYSSLTWLAFLSINSRIAAWIKTLEIPFDFCVIKQTFSL